MSMMILRDRLVNTPIMSLQTGGQIGTTAAPIIDPQKLQIVAFYCEGQGIGFSPAVLHTQDIREFSSIGLIVDSTDDIMPPDDLVRLKKILEYHFELDGMRVEDDHGQKLGKIVDFSVDAQSFFIIKLHVKPSLLQSFNTTEFLIGRDQIAAITNEKIVVKAPEVREKQKAPIKAPPMENPFRSARPQPEPIVEQPRQQN